MNRPVKTIWHQRGAVAIIVGITIFVLVMIVGLVVDLGFLYTRKTELQNAADAAALAGAKELNGSTAGINAGTAKAIELAAANSVDFGGNPISITNSEIEFGPSPDGPWSSVAQAQSAPADKSFIKIDTSGILQGSHPTWFMRVAGFDATTTYGMAVAGRYTLHVSPLGVCAVDPSRPEHGFLRGVAYNIPELNPLGVQPDHIWINAVDAYPGPCTPANATPQVLAPFVCTGRAASITTLPGRVYYNTGREAVLEGPLNSRFGVPASYTGGHACSPDTAPADTNVKEFVCTNPPGGGPNPDNCFASATMPANSPRDWMDPATTTIPTQQSIETRPRTDPVAPRKPFNYPLRSSPEITDNFSKYGVLWSYSREISDFTTTPYTEYGPADWLNLYGGQAQNYPATSPYSTYVVPPAGPGAAHKQANRRVLNLVIINCRPELIVNEGGGCRTLPVLAIGKFFMQRKADLPQHLDVEFAGIMAPPMPPADIKLYR